LGNRATLAQIGEPTIEPLLSALRDESQPAQGFAVRALVGIGKPAGEPLIRLLDDEDCALRALAAKALGLMRDVRAVRPLIIIAQDDNEDARIEAIRALVAIGEPAADSCLDALFRKPASWQIAAHIAAVLGLIGSVAVVDRLVETLQFPANEMRFLAALILGDIGDTHAVAPLVAALGDPDANLRTVVAAGLGKLGDARAIAPLAGALNDPEDAVREAAANALKDLKQVLIAPLTVFLEDENDTVRAIAAKAVEMLPN
jgi:HEAT repeat protein